MGLERCGLGVEGEVSRLAFLVYDSIMYCQASTELTCHTPQPFTVALITLLVI